MEAEGGKIKIRSVAIRKRRDSTRRGQVRFVEREKTASYWTRNLVEREIKIEKRDERKDPLSSSSSKEGNKGKRKSVRTMDDFPSRLFQVSRSRVQIYNVFPISLSLFLPGFLLRVRRTNVPKRRRYSS